MDRLMVPSGVKNLKHSLIFPGPGHHPPLQTLSDVFSEGYRVVAFRGTLREHEIRLARERDPASPRARIREGRAGGERVPGWSTVYPILIQKYFLVALATPLVKFISFRASGPRSRGIFFRL